MSGMRRGANRVRNILDAEEMAHQEDRHWEFERMQQLRRDAARDAGYHVTSLADPFPPYVCPICGGSVTLTGVETHIAWHERLG